MRRQARQLLRKAAGRPEQGSHPISALITPVPPSPSRPGAAARAGAQDGRVQGPPPHQPAAAAPATGASWGGRRAGQGVGGAWGALGMPAATITSAARWQPRDPAHCPGSSPWQQQQLEQQQQHGASQQRRQHAGCPPACAPSGVGPGAPPPTPPTPSATSTAAAAAVTAGGVWVGGGARWHGISGGGAGISGGISGISRGCSSGRHPSERCSPAAPPPGSRRGGGTQAQGGDYSLAPPGGAAPAAWDSGRLEDLYSLDPAGKRGAPGVAEAAQMELVELDTVEVCVTCGPEDSPFTEVGGWLAG